MRRSPWPLIAVALLLPGAVPGQTVQNATLRRAQQSFDNLDYRQALITGKAALLERLTGFERARAYELLGFTYSGMDSILRAVDAFKQVVLIEQPRHKRAQAGTLGFDGGGQAGGSRSNANEIVV